MTAQATQFSTLLHSHTSLKPKSQVDPAKAMEAAHKFEASFASHVIQQLFAGNKKGLFGGGETEVMFRSIWAGKIAEFMAGQFKIAEAVYPTLLRNQGDKREVMLRSIWAGGSAESMTGQFGIAEATQSTLLNNPDNKNVNCLPCPSQVSGG
jgi:Rod binding domain-containing protein